MTNTFECISILMGTKALKPKELDSYQGSSSISGWRHTVKGMGECLTLELSQFLLFLG